MTDSAASAAANSANAANAAAAANAAKSSSAAPKSNTSNSAASSSVAGSSLGAVSGDFNNFLTLLTTQLQNQDPTNPMDTDQMTQEIAQLSMVQAQDQTNTTLTSLLNAYTNSQTSSVVGYIGKRVEATPASGTAATSTLQNGGAEFVYNLGSAAATATVTIKDSSGNVVYSGNGSTTSGRNVVFWDGVNSSTGAQEPDGAYTYTVTATDGTGNPVTATTFTTGQVTGVEMSNGTPTLDIGNGAASVPLTGITQVEADPVAQAQTTPTPTGNTTTNGTTTS